MSDKIYPDTAQGALAYLKEDSSLNLEGAKCFPDPQVDGVWKITTPNDENADFAIVYLAGYKDPFGRIRIGNDFESIYPCQDGEDEEDEDDSEEYGDDWEDDLL